MNHKVKCTNCNSPVVKRYRKSDQHPFYGCTSFPDCRRTMTVRRYNEKMYSEIGENPPGYEAFEDLDIF